MCINTLHKGDSEDDDDDDDDNNNNNNNNNNGVMRFNKVFSMTNHTSQTDDGDHFVRHYCAAREMSHRKNLTNTGQNKYTFQVLERYKTVSTHSRQHGTLPCTVTN
jgi:hypothetical protein